MDANAPLEQVKQHADGTYAHCRATRNALRFGSPLRLFLLLGRTGIVGGRHP